MINRSSRLRGSIGVEQRKRIRLRDGYKCRCCSIAVRIGEVDHIIPLEQGGTNDDTNLQLLCSGCHKAKTARDMGYVLRLGCDLDGNPSGSNHHWNK